MGGVKCDKNPATKLENYGNLSLSLDIDQGNGYLFIRIPCFILGRHSR